MKNWLELVVLLLAVANVLMMVYAGLAHFRIDGLLRRVRMLEQQETTR